MTQPVTPEDAIQVLNQLVALDPEAATALVNTRYPCTEELADHPHITVWKPEGNEVPVVGFLGVLNGIFRDKGWEPIVAEFEGENLVRFSLHKPKG